MLNIQLGFQPLCDSTENFILLDLVFLLLNIIDVQNFWEDKIVYRKSSFKRSVSIVILHQKI
jgi:hypothetical protein